MMTVQYNLVITYGTQDGHWRVSGKCAVRGIHRASESDG
jgi:hypothetical protein